jgi:hypothetical protein
MSEDYLIYLDIFCLILNLVIKDSLYIAPFAHCLLPLLICSLYSTDLVLYGYVDSIIFIPALNSRSA